VKTESTKNVNNEKKKKIIYSAGVLQLRIFLNQSKGMILHQLLQEKQIKKKYNKKISSEIANDHLSVIV